MENTNLYPIKLLFDEKMKPFVPLVTVDCVLVNGTDKTAQDLFNERYTKAETDQIIKDLGTLQRLRGTLDTYEELLAIQNPVAGDTYIVKNTNKDSNYQEYMYIGDRWEELGPFVDFSNYDTKAEVDAKIEAHNTTIRAFIVAEDNRILEAAKTYTDEIMAGADKLDIEVNKTGKVATISIYRKDGSIEETQIYDGETGPQGEIGVTPNIQIGDVSASEPDAIPQVSRTGTNEDPVFNFVLPRGPQGPEGPEGPAVPVDDEISDTSENAVKSRVVKEYIDSILGDINARLEEVVEGTTTE